MSLAWGRGLVARVTRSGAGAIQPQMASWWFGQAPPGFLALTTLWLPERKHSTALPSFFWLCLWNFLVTCTVLLDFTNNSFYFSEPCWGFEPVLSNTVACRHMGLWSPWNGISRNWGVFCKVNNIHKGPQRLRMNTMSVNDLNNFLNFECMLKWNYFSYLELNKIYYWCQFHLALFVFNYVY